MLEQVKEYQIFPKFDHNKGKDKLHYSNQTQVLSNYYKIELKTFQTIYQYSIGFEPELPQNATKLIEKIMDSIRAQLLTKLGLICWKGKMLWGNIKQELALIVKTSIQFKGEKQSYDLIFKMAPRTLTLNDFLSKDANNMSRLTQLLNINIKNALRQTGYKQLDRGRYYNAEDFGQQKMKEAGLSIWRGYEITVTCVNGNFFLKADVCSRILRLQSFLETIKNTKNFNDKAYINQTFKQSSIITRYGNHKLFKIFQIDYTMTPKSTFENNTIQKVQSFVEYYKTTYSCTIKDLDQPLIKVIVQNGQQKKVQYLVPQFVSLTGLTDVQRKDFHVMKAIAQRTKLRVNERVDETNIILNKLTKEGSGLLMDISLKAHRFDAEILNSPNIQVGKKKIIHPNKGEIELRDPLHDPIDLKNYLFVYTSRGDIDDNDADATYNLLQKASRAYGIKVSKPLWVNINCINNVRPTVKKWIEEIEVEIKNKKPSFAILYFNNEEKNDQRFYTKLKDFLIHKHFLNSQVITKRTLSANAKGGLSKASKILLQINDKMGHPLYKIEKQHPFWNKNTIAIGSLASSKGLNGEILSFVGTRSADLTQHYSNYFRIQKKQKIQDEIISTFFSSWLKSYFNSENRNLPSTLVIYREGLNEVQAKMILQQELKVINKVFEEVKIKAAKKDWKPKLIYLLVNRKTGTRIYNIDRKNQIQNPISGTTVGSQISKDGAYEFLMASAKTTEGTCNMVQYKVVYDSSNQQIPHQAVKIITYEQCYNYPNWAGAIRIPATLQKANKLAKFVSTNGDGKIDKENPLNFLDYYI